MVLANRPERNGPLDDELIVALVVRERGEGELARGSEPAASGTSGSTATGVTGVTGATRSGSQSRVSGDGERGPFPGGDTRAIVPFACPKNQRQSVAGGASAWLDGTRGSWSWVGRSLVILSVVILVLVLLLGAVVLYRSVRRVPEQSVEIVERFGRYHRTVGPGSSMVVVPLVDQVLARVDLREQVIAWPPQPIILSDGLVVKIEWVISFEVIDPKAAVYEVANFQHALEQLGVTALRAIGADMNLEQISASRTEINVDLRKTLDENAQNWGIRVNRAEIKAIEPSERP
jgi:hypothetical protein